jgi:serine protease Do
LQVLRNGSERDMTVKLGVLPADQEQASVEPPNPQGALEGVTVGNVTDPAVQQFNLPANTKGVVVTGIDPSSPVADSGFQQGDGNQEVNHQPVTNGSDFNRAVSKAGKNPLLLGDRQGSTLFIAA